MSNFTKSDVGIYLGIYASIIATLTGLWALFHNVFRDRARVTVKVFEAYRVKVKDDPRWLIIRGEDTLRTMGITPAMRRSVLDVEVRNRGRRDVQIDDVAQARLGGSFKFGDLHNQAPFDLPPRVARHSSSAPRVATSKATSSSSDSSPSMGRVAFTLCASVGDNGSHDRSAPSSPGGGGAQAPADAPSALAIRGGGELAQRRLLRALSELMAESEQDHSRTRITPEMRPAPPHSRPEPARCEVSREAARLGSPAT